MPRLRTAAAVTVATVSALIAFAPAAGAHVSVVSADATQGGYAVVTFRVPNEEANASTTKLEVQLPADTPIAYAAVEPIPGWTAVATKTKLATPVTTDDGQVTEAVTRLTWTATAAAAIKPGEFGQFDVQLGPLPKQSSVTFPAIQTYSNGTVARWIEIAAPGASTQPDKPAPVLRLAAAGTSGSATAGPGASVAAGPAATSASPSSNTGPIVLSIIAVVLAAAALGVAVVGRARRAA